MAENTDITLQYKVETAHGANKLSFVVPYNIAEITIESNVHLLTFRCRITKGGAEADPLTGELVDERTDVAAGKEFTFEADTLVHFKGGEGSYKVTLYAEDDEGKWNTESFFIVVTSKPLRTNSGQAFKAIYTESEGRIKISFDGTSGTGTQSTITARQNIPITLPACTFVPPAEMLFNAWAVGSISGPKVSAGSTYTFSSANTCYALWETATWRDNEKSTWDAAHLDGWYGSSSTVWGFVGTVDPSSVYNIPNKVAETPITTVYGMGSMFSGSTVPAFTKIGGKEVLYVGGGASYAFGNNQALTEVSFPNCTSVGTHAFYGCYALSSAYMPNCITFASGAFQACSALRTAVFNSCTYVSSSAFNGCQALSIASFPLCSYVGSFGFYNTYSLAEAYFPNCEYVGENGFGVYNSTITTAFKTISLPKCSYIGSMAFYARGSLVSVYLLSTSVVTLEALTAFGACSTSLKVYVPESLWSLYISATPWKWMSASIKPYSG